MAEVAKMLVLSTAHLSEATAQRFDNATDCLVETAMGQITVYQKGDVGWLVPIADDYIDCHTTRAYLPGDFTQVCDKAESLGCSWIMFDRDADTLTGLKVYDW